MVDDNRQRVLVEMNGRIRTIDAYGGRDMEREWIGRRSEVGMV